jgi:hypothetical protein
MNHRSGLNRRKPTWIALLLLAAAPAFAVPTSTATLTAARTPALRINEVLTSNPLKRNGTSSDLIELYNAGSTAVDLGGKSIQDQPADPTNVKKFTFPSGTTLAAGAYLVIYADDTNTPAGFHTGFALDSEGDSVRLIDSSANGSVEIDSITFGFQVADYSIGRTGTAGNVWALTVPTFGAANGNSAGLAGPAVLKINEWAGNIVFRLDHDMIELYNPGNQPVAIGGVRLTDDITVGKGFKFPSLSFMGPAGFLPLYKGDYLFGLNGDQATVTLLGENNEQIDQITMRAEPNDRSIGRSPDGSANIVTFNIPSPGISNTTPFPPAYNDLLNNLRITEIMYQPTATSGSSDYEYIELQNVGTTALDLTGVRFSNGLDYTFPAYTLSPGAFVVVVNDRSSFLSRYPGAASVMAPGGFNGGLDNSGETISLTLPAPWKVHIVNFRFQRDWYPAASGGGYSIVAASTGTPPAGYQDKSGWKQSATVNGNPGAADPNTTTGTIGGGGGPITARLVNLSILTNIATAGDNFTMGYVVGGSGTSGSKPVLIRAAGPSLTQLGVTGVLADPKLELFAKTTASGNNDNWGGTATLSTAFAAVGAFPYASPTSLDAAALATIPAGDNSVRVSANGNGTGTVIAELYDSTPATGFTATTPRLVNVSVLKNIGTGLTAGFVIGGTGSKTVLIRAVGPTLATAPFNVSGVVADPQLTLFSGQSVLGTNDNWGGSASLAATFSAVGAFALPAGSRDAALVATLEPGINYTVRVTGVGASTGQALIEVYEVP